MGGAGDGEGGAGHHLKLLIVLHGIQQPGSRYLTMPGNRCGPRCMWRRVAAVAQWPQLNGAASALARSGKAFVCCPSPALHGSHSWSAPGSLGRACLPHPAWCPCPPLTRSTIS